jgi:hypothetical protein
VDILERIIENLTSDEVRRFKILSNRFKADDEKKLLVLFDAIRAGNYKEVEPQVIAQFYGDASPRSRNSYYRLRNKLLSNLEKSLLFYHFNYKNSIEAYSYIQLAILLRERGLYREAYYNLKKAEKAATENDQFNVLEIIYDKMVELALNHDVEIEAVIKRRKANLKKIELLRANSEVLGVITSQLNRRNYSRSKGSQSVIDQLEQIRSQLEEHEDIFRSPSSRIIILRTVLSILVQKSAYRELETYLSKTFAEFEQNGWFDKENHSTRILMRIWRINSLQKLLELSASGQEIEALWHDLKQYKKQNFNEFSFHYYLTQVYNLKLSGELEKAGQTLKEAFKHREILQQEVHELYLLISLADQRFSENHYGGALQTIEQIQKHKVFNGLDGEVRFYVQIFKLVNLFEAQEYKLAEKDYKSLKKRFKAFLKDEFYAKARRFLEILMRLNRAAIEGKKVFLKSAYQHFTNDYPPSEIGGNQIIQYEIYLRSKLEESSYYQLLRESVEKKSR